MEPQKTIALISYFKFYHGAIFLLLTLMIINPSPCTASRSGNETDQLALLAFKSQIVGDPYEILSSWNESRPHCQWPGVTCGHKHQRVTSLNLYKQNLFGPISAHIGNLSFLNFLSLRINRLYGEIPQEIERLYRLREVHLNNNTLGGPIPFIFSNCTELETLSLGVNKLMGEVPESLSSLKKLVVLALDDNYLSGEIPRSFQNLSALQVFSVAYNNLQGRIPNELGKLRSLTWFSVTKNNLSGIIPNALYNISSLEIFSVSSNQLTGFLPSDIGSSLPNLNVLDMGTNLFSGRIPASLANISRLQQICIPNNSFIGPVPNNLNLLSGLNLLNIERNQLGGNSTQDLSFLEPLSNCSDLNAISFYHNKLGGKLPNSIANLSVELETIIMGSNNIYGPIPEALMHVTSLYTLEMENNLFSGAIPSSIGRLQKLQRLLLYENQMSGQIPSSFGNISQLGQLSIRGNRFSGEIPETLGHCQRLEFLDMSGNKLTGAIPPQVISIPSLSIALYLSKNSLSGQLPAEVGKLVSLNEFDISENKLSGQIPPSIGDCLSMEYLNMSGNSFQGTIPSSLASLRGIKYLDLSRNNLSGQIPKALEDLTNLLSLNLSFNYLEGEMPRKGVFGNASAISLVGNTKLCGGIPELKQPSCPNTQEKKTHKISYEFKLIAAVAGGVVLLTALTYSSISYWRRKNRKFSVVASFGKEKFMKISYWDLYKATNGFSPENLIGSGSFGSVYRGKLNQQMDNVIAVKVLNLANNRASKSFAAECKILKNVRHRNLLKILTYCSSIDARRNEFKALVYEFMPNGNLDMWLHPDEANSSRTLTLLQRVDIAIDVACALQYLHSHCEAPVVHCDLKPSNILVDDDMCACVGDFGLAKITGEISETNSIGLRGSVGYAAPEYGTGSEVSASGDIYSYGIILLEMMTARRPTDDIFKDGLDLHAYVEKALPRHINQIIDPLIYREEQADIVEEEESSDNSDEIVMEEQGRKIGTSSHRENLKACIMSILTIGLACSQKSPAQRMDMNDVNKELHHVKDALLGRGRNRR